MLSNSNREALPKAKSQKPRAALTVLCLAGLALGAQPPSDRIGPDTVGRLAVAWTYDTRESTEPFRPGADRPAFEATPVYAANRLYCPRPAASSSRSTRRQARSAGGSISKVRRDANYSDFANRGVTVAGDRIYSARSMRGSSASIAATAASATASARTARSTSSPGSDESREWQGEYGVTSPPVVYRDLVIVGSSVADNSRVRMSSGEVRAFDAASGALRWTFHPLPENAAAGGANTWSRMTVDDASGLVFLPTGSASPDYFGGLRQGDNGHANTIVALHAATGDVAWSFQTVHHDLWDYDVASPPLLFPGKSGPAVAVGSKTGHLFLFDRMTGRPLFPIRERPVPRATSRRDGGGDAAVSRAAAEPGAAADHRAGHLGCDAAGSRGVPGHVPRAAQRRHVHAAEPPWKHQRARQHRRAPLGRDGLGSGEPSDHRAREPPPRDHPALAEGGLRSREEGQSEAGDHRAGRRAVLDVAPVSPRALGHPVRGAAMGRAGRGTRRYR